MLLHKTNILMIFQGHEFTGTVEETGSEVKNFKKGDQVVSPFTVSWSALFETFQPLR